MDSIARRCYAYKIRDLSAANDVAGASAIEMHSGMQRQHVTGRFFSETVPAAFN